eukprot:XP_011601481.1 PREDICTED: uncharacterized protein K02A2.6-like [Takifugu rubripes]
MYTLYKLDELDIPAEAPFIETLTVNGTDTQFEMDSGCGVTVVNYSVFKTLRGKGTPKLCPCRVRLKTYTGHKVKVLGAAVVKVQNQGRALDLPVVVVGGAGPSLVGRYWIRRLGLQWRETPQVHHVRVETAEEVQMRPETQIHNVAEETLDEVLEEYGKVFKDELGRFKGPPAKIYVDKEAAPRFFKARPVPYAMRGRVEAELDRLLAQKIIEPVKHSEWATPVVPVLKPDDTVRLCGDYKLTVNQISKLEQYPIPKIEDLFATLSGGQKFSKLDLSHAYHQISLDEEAKKYVTINTHKGLFTYRVLPFGVSSSPAIFQRTMEGLLQGIPHVTIFLDDILLTGKDDREHLQTLARVLKRLQEAGLRLKRSKCLFMNEEVMFLGHKVDATGLHPVHEKLDKEGLAVMFGIKRFHKYIYGRKFTIVTDHKPLLGLFSEMRAVPQMASPRIQRWAVTLRAYEYTIVYKEGRYHCNADALSRLPLPEVTEEELEERVLMLESSDITLVTADQVKAWTDADPVLSRVREMVQNGWSSKEKREEFGPYEVRKYELSIKDGCVLWGSRVVVPKAGQENVMRQLHQCHPGVSRMKALARSYVWWPKLDKEVEDTVKSCMTCLEYRNVPAPAPLHPWDWPDKPWSRIHVDYAGPFMEKMFFVLIDAHSKWMDVYPVNSATSTTTIECLLLPIVANLYMQEALTSFIGTAPSHWYRYVDDRWIKIRTVEVEAFIEHINTVDKNITFTREDVRGSSLSFLDCAVHIEVDSSLNIKIYRKPTNTDQYLLVDSHHPLEHKLVVIRTLHNWAQNIPTRTEGKEEEQKHIKRVLKTCGYPGWSFIKFSRKSRENRRISQKNGTTLLFHMLQYFLRRNKHNIPVQVKPSNTLRQKRVHPKGQNTETQSNIVYAVQCSEECPNMGSFNGPHNERQSNPHPGDLALNVFLAPEEYKHLELCNSELELMKPLGEG